MMLVTRQGRPARSAKYLRHASSSTLALRQRLHRGDDERPEGGQGLLPRGARPRTEFDARQRRAVPQRRPRPTASPTSSMPIMNNMGNLQLRAHGRDRAAPAGGVPTSASAGVALRWASSPPSCNMSKQLRQPIGQVSQQLNCRHHGAWRARSASSDLMDEAPRDRTRATSRWSTPSGTRTAALTEADERTGLWAWKHPHRRRHRHLHPAEGRRACWTTWTSATTPEKTVLHDISLYAKPGQKIAFVGATGAGKTTITNLHQPVLRHCRRQDPLRRHQHQQDQKGRSAPLAGHRSAGHQPVHRHGDGEHPLRPAWTPPTRSASPRPKLANADDFIRTPAPGLRHAC